MMDPHTWTNELLDDMRTKGDPKADQAAEALFDAVRGHDPKEISAFIVRFVSQDFTKAWQNQNTIPDPPVLVAYFEDFEEFKFSAADIEYLEKGSDIFERHGPMITFGLGVRSLLKQYAHTKAIEVLRLTTLLVKFVNRRILETMQFVLDVMSPDWVIKSDDGTFKLNLHHPGLLSIKKLRLVHAMIRYRIRNKMYDVSLGDYDISVFGIPINQEDMVFAVHTFSLEIIEGLRTMKINVTDEEAEIYFECWKIIGRGLGVDKALEPSSYKDALNLQNLIYQRHFTLPNSTGPILSVALMNWFVSTVPLLNEKLLITFIRDFNGPENYSILTNNLKIDIGNSHPDLKAQLTNELHFDEKQSRPGLKATNKEDLALDNFFLHFIRTLINVERGGKNEHFRCGDGFSAAWDLNQIRDKPLPKWRVFLLAVWTFIKRLFSSSHDDLTKEKKPE
jgi:hypothetical protein